MQTIIYFKKVLIGNKIHTFKVYYKNDVFYAHVKFSASTYHITVQVFERFSLDLVKHVYAQTIISLLSVIVNL